MFARTHPQPTQRSQRRCRRKTKPSKTGAPRGSVAPGVTMHLRRDDPVSSRASGTPGSPRHGRYHALLGPGVCTPQQRHGEAEDVHNCLAVGRRTRAIARRYARVVSWCALQTTPCLGRNRPDGCTNRPAGGLRLCVRLLSVDKRSQGLFSGEREIGQERRRGRRDDDLHT